METLRAASALLGALFGTMLSLGAAAPMGTGRGSAEWGAQGDAPSFADEVRPILEGRCLECHGGQLRRPKGRLWLHTRAKMLKGGVGGPAVEPGEPDESLIIQAVRYDDEWLEMPPDAKLPEEEIDVLTRWVAAGAPWPEGVEVAFRPPLEPAEPESGGESSEEQPPQTEPAPSEEFPPEALQFFEREVRPLLADNCFECHGPDVEHPKSGLAMHGRAALLAGGDSGPAVVPGDPDASALVRAVRYDDPLRKMPPSGKLPASSVRVLEQWVASGAPWPGGSRATGHADASAGVEPYDYAEARRRWAFQPVERPPLPELGGEGAVQPIDAFVGRRLQQAGLSPSPRAMPRELVRRVYADLIGLPPTLADVRRFEREAAVDHEAAWDALIDDLLARPQYGERWGRHWLDVVRFAQTNGYERDAEKPFAWRYRDWVIDALNRDLGYDEFVLHQLAGDELDEVTAESRIATGFYRVGPWDDEPNDPLEAEYDELDDVVRTISEGFLGVTIGCARCHDHKFDPFPQEDYYSLLAFVKSVDPYDNPQFALDSATHWPLDRSEDALARWEAERREAMAEARREVDELLGEGRRLVVEERVASLPAAVQRAYRTPADQRDDAQRQLLRSTAELRPTRDEALAKLSEDARLRLREMTADAAQLRGSYAGSLPWALTVRDKDREPDATRLLLRGRAATPGPEVEPRFPRVLCSDDAAAAPPPPTAPARPNSTGRRRLLADWIVRADNPLTARVIVNRVWHHHFGRGLVPTPNDFGSTGLPPSHPELLDWLAAEFVAHGWSLKWLHREVLRSHTWQQSSRVRPAAQELDPENALLSRQNLRRLDAEVLRDAVLAVSGSLVEEAGGRGFFPALSRETLAGMSRPGRGWERDGEAARARRSVYAYAKRGLPVPFFETFDAPTASLPTGARPTTTIVTQALTLLNSDFVNRQADLLAERVLAEAGGDPGEQVRRAFERVLARTPGPAEVRALLEFVDEQTRSFAATEARLFFQPRIPDRIDMGYLGELEGHDLLYGPRAGWSYHDGQWGGSYNGTLEWSATDGPAALYEEVGFVDGRVEARLRMERGSTLAAVLLRARGTGAGVRGLELALLPEDGLLELRELGADGGVLARARRPLGAERWYEIRIELAGRAVQVFVDGEEVLTSRAAPAPVPGHLGVRTMTEGLEFDRLVIDPVPDSNSGGAAAATGEPWVLRPDAPAAPAQRALQALCLLLLNTNEFVYVD